MIILDKVSIKDIVSYGGDRLQSIINNGSAALLSISTADGGGSESSYFSIGARSRAAAGYEAGLAFNREERYENIEVEQLFLRHQGIIPEDGSILHPYVGDLARQNKQHRYEFHLGYIGEVLKKSNLQGAVIGNADTQVPRRMVVTIVMDSQGVVPLGSVSDELLRKSPDFPYGVCCNAGAYLEEWENVKDKASLVAVDWGDTARIDLYSHHLTPARREQLLVQSLQELEIFLKGISQRPGRLIMLITPSPSRFHGFGNKALTPLFLESSGQEKVLMSSPTTRRPGLLAGIDIAPIVLSYLEVFPELEFYSRITKTPAANRMSYLEEMEQKTFLINRQRPQILQGYVLCQILLLLGGFFGIIFRYRPTLWLRFPMKSILLVPLVLLILAPWSFFPMDNIYYSGLLIIAVTILLTGLLELFQLETRALLSIIGLITSFLIVMDLLRRAPWMQMGFLGYDPIAGARFYGIGNEYMGVLIGSLILGTSFLLSVVNKRVAKFLTPICLLLYLLIIILMASPAFGTNFGGTITAAVGFGFTFALFCRTPDYKSYFYVPFLFVGISIFFLFLLNVTRQFAIPSHLSQTWDLFQEKGKGSIWLIIQRKLAMNWRLIKYSFWSRAMLTFIALAVTLVFRPAGLVQKVLSANTYLRSGLAGGMLAGVT
ncbi:MAG: hypothetical protein GX767_08845, partial [Firmicutes bacterium]|nr:hypothetical protein [Bacillota bacterium]